ncbi:MAG: hypothetical protein WB799_21565 [Candidatus Sulfotelmatobacter sp.]
MKRSQHARRFLFVLMATLVYCESASTQEAIPGPGQETVEVQRPTLTGSNPKPQDGAKAILAAFDKYEVVGMGAAHGSQDLDDFILNLIRSPELPSKINDIVVECGNSLYQPILDRYIAGDNVPLDEARQVWRNTTQPMCGVSAFYEELFPLVRRINQKLPPEKKFRMVAADPPIDWSKMKTAADFGRGQFLMRDPVIASMMEKEVLSKHRKALILFGTLHLYPSHGENAPMLVSSAVETYEKNYPGVTFVISDHTGFGNDSPLTKYNDEFESRMASWPIPSLAQDLPGTWLADLLDKTHTLASGVIFFRVRKDGKRTESPVDSGDVPASKMVDAYLYLGPRDLLLKEPLPAEVFLDKDYIAEMRRRAAIMGGDSIADQANPEKISDRDYSPFFYDPNEMQKMTGFKKMMPLGTPQPPK